MHALQDVVWALGIAFGWEDAIVIHDPTDPISTGMLGTTTAAHRRIHRIATSAL